jgi:hypothetical protein
VTGGESVDSERIEISSDVGETVSKASATDSLSVAEAPSVIDYFFMRLSIVDFVASTLTGSCSASYCSWQVLSLISFQYLKRLLESADKVKISFEAPKFDSPHTVNKA